MKKQLSTLEFTISVDKHALNYARMDEYNTPNLNVVVSFKKVGRVFSNIKQE